MLNEYKYKYILNKHLNVYIYINVYVNIYINVYIYKYIKSERSEPLLYTKYNTIFVLFCICIIIQFLYDFARINLLYSNGRPIQL